MTFNSRINGILSENENGVLIGWLEVDAARFPIVVEATEQTSKSGSIYKRFSASDGSGLHGICLPKGGFAENGKPKPALSLLFDFGSEKLAAIGWNRVSSKTQNPFIGLSEDRPRAA